MEIIDPKKTYVLKQSAVDSLYSPNKHFYNNDNKLVIKREYKSNFESMYKRSPSKLMKGYTTTMGSFTEPTNRQKKAPQKRPIKLYPITNIEDLYGLGDSEEEWKNNNLLDDIISEEKNNQTKTKNYNNERRKKDKKSNSKDNKSKCGCKCILF